MWTRMESKSIPLFSKGLFNDRLKQYEIGLDTSERRQQNTVAIIFYDVV